MKKITKVLLFTITMMLCFFISVTANAVYSDYWIYYGDYGYYLYDYDWVALADYRGSKTSVITPTVIDGETMNFIGYEAFAYNTAIEEITVSEGIEYVDSCAFWNCFNLKKVILPDSVTGIGEMTFGNCKELTDISIPNGVDTLKYAVFYGCINLESVYLSDTIKTIDSFAFMNCDNLKNIYYEGTKEQWGKIEFQGDFDNVTIHYNSADYEHSFSVSKREATCSKEGELIYTCNCGAVRKEAVPLTEHSYGEPIYDIDFSIYPYDTQTLTCKVCGYTKKEQYLTDYWSARIGSEEGYDYVNLIWGERDDIGGIKIYQYNKETKKYFLLDHLSGVAEEYKVTGLEPDTEYSFLVVYYGCWDWSGEEGEEEEKDITHATEVTVKTKAHPKSHTVKTVTTKATLKKNGKTATKCTVCDYVSKSAKIYKIKSVKLSATTYTYNGKTKTPSVTVKDSKGKKLKKGTDYTVTYPKKRKAVGKYTVTVTFKGKYSGTKKLTFEIVPAKVKISKLTAGKKQLTAAWKTVSGATGYEVVYSTSKKFTKKTTKKVTVKKAKTKKTTIKKLKKGKKYYVKVRAYKTVSGKKIYGAYSAVKSIKVK